MICYRPPQLQQLQQPDRQQNGAGELFEKFQRQRQNNGEANRGPMDKRTNELANAYRQTPTSAQTNNGTTSGTTVKSGTASENVSQEFYYIG